MMRKRPWVFGDPHFSHAGICRFVNYDQTKMRPWDDPAVMDEALVDNWNSVVAPEDRVYVMGDIAMPNSAATILRRCNGRKVLIKGNHDNGKLSLYVGLFDDIRATDARKEFGRKFVMSHVPLHPDCLDRWGLNIHGHLHSNSIKLPDGTRDPRYVCVSAEQIDYRPKLLEEVLAENPL